MNNFLKIPKNDKLFKKYTLVYQSVCTFEEAIQTYLNCTRVVILYLVSNVHSHVIQSNSLSFN